MGQIYSKKSINYFYDKNIDHTKKYENILKRGKKVCDFFYGQKRAFKNIEKNR